MSSSGLGALGGVRAASSSRSFCRLWAEVSAALAAQTAWRVVCSRLSSRGGGPEVAGPWEGWRKRESGVQRWVGERGAEGGGGRGEGGRGAGAGAGGGGAEGAGAAGAEGGRGEEEVRSGAEAAGKEGTGAEAWVWEGKLAGRESSSCWVRDWDSSKNRSWFAGRF